MRSGSSMRISHAQSYVIKETQNKLEMLGWETVPHPPYSPGLAPSDYRLFRSSEKFLSSKSFEKYEDLELAVSDFFDSQPFEFWAKGISDLSTCWTDLVDNSDGDYIIDWI